MIATLNETVTINRDAARSLMAAYVRKLETGTDYSILEVSNDKDAYCVTVPASQVSRYETVITSTHKPYDPECLDIYQAIAKAYREGGKQFIYVSDSWYEEDIMEIVRMYNVVPDKTYCYEDHGYAVAVVES